MLCGLGRFAASAVCHRSQACAWLDSSRLVLVSRAPHATTDHCFNRGPHSRSLRQLCSAAGPGSNSGSKNNSNDSKGGSSSRDSTHPSKVPGVASIQDSQEISGDDPAQSPAEVEQQETESAQTYRQIMSTWIASREVDVRGLAAESSLAVRDFLADPSVSLFGRQGIFHSISCHLLLSVPIHGVLFLLNCIR